MNHGEQQSHTRKQRLRRLRPTRYRLMILILESLRVILPRLPHRLVIWLGQLIGHLAGLICNGTHREAVQRYLDSGLAEDKQDASRSMRHVFSSLGAGGFEWLHSKGWDAAQFKTNIEWDGREHVLQALERRKGVIMITAHLGSWEMLLRSYLVEIGGEIAAVAADMRYPGLDRWLKKVRHEEGCRWISVREGLVGIVRHLRKGGAVIILADQDSRRGRGVFVDFFGRPAHTLSAPARLAWKTGAGMVPFTIVRSESNPRNHQVRVDPPIYPITSATEKEETLRLTQAHTYAIEQHILRAPTQWAWIHDRWRHQPGDEIKIRSPR